MPKPEEHARLLEIVAELKGLSEELGSIDSESAALLKRSLDAGLRAAPEPDPKKPG